MKKHTKVVLSRIVASALVVGAMFSNVIADPALDTAPAAVEEVADSVVTPPSKFSIPHFAKNPTKQPHHCRKRFRWVGAASSSARAVEPLHVYTITEYKDVRSHLFALGSGSPLPTEPARNFQQTSNIPNFHQKLCKFSVPNSCLRATFPPLRAYILTGGFFTLRNASPKRAPHGCNRSGYAKQTASLAEITGTFLSGQGSEKNCQ